MEDRQRIEFHHDTSKTKTSFPRSHLSFPHLPHYSTSLTPQGRSRKPEGCIAVIKDEFLSTSSEYAHHTRAHANEKFLTHPQPLMFVAGLTPSRDRSGSTAQSNSRRPSDASRPPASGSGSGSTYLDPSQSTALNSITPLTSPSTRQRELPKSPPPPISPGSQVAPTDPKEEKDEKDRDFDKLVSDLKGALEAKSGSGKVWIPEGERKDFRIMLVDKVCLAFHSKLGAISSTRRQRKANS